MRVTGAFVILAVMGAALPAREDRSLPDSI